MKVLHLAMIYLVVLVFASSSQAQNITLLLNSQTIEGIGDGSPLNSWTGDVGSASATSAPSFISASNLNGLPGVRFDAVDDGMTTTLAQTSGAYTIMTVYSHNDTSDANSNFRRVLNGGAGAGTENWLIGPYGEDQRHYANGWVTNPGPAAGTAPALATAINTGIGSGTSTFFVNGVDETDNAAPNGAIGELALGTAGQYFEVADSDLGLVLAFDAALTPDQQAGVEFIVADNFGLTGFSATTDQIAQGTQLLAGTSLIKAAVPEPASIAVWSLIGLGLGGFGYFRLRWKKGRFN